MGNQMARYVQLILFAMLFLPSLAMGAVNVSAVAVEAKTGRILFEHDSDRIAHPASLTKLMTLYLLFESLDSGKIKLKDRIPFSARAAAEPRMKLGVRAGDSITVEEAILSLVVLSANDVATAVSEWLGGSKGSRFIRRMNNTAKQLKMYQTSFRNAHGLHDANQVTTVKDIAKLAIYLRVHFPHHYHYFSRDSFAFRGKTIRGHNAITSKYVEVDGLKTGFINASGYNLATSVTKGDLSLVAVVIGGPSVAARDEFMGTLINSIAEKKTGQPLTVSPNFTIKNTAAQAKKKTNKKQKSNLYKA